MALVYKTPGVYIEEIPKFPPIISGVDTAIPAFIGYTEKLVDVALLEPKRITSMAQYEAYFGLPRKEEKLTVVGTQVKDAAGTVVGQSFAATLAQGDRSEHILYYALQLYFANGGGPCWIVPVGLYNATGVERTDFEAGLLAVEKVDEPTLLVFPEAPSLGVDDYRAVMDAALAQCELLKDRFVIMDAHGDDKHAWDPAAKIGEVVGKFRDKGVGAINLKYGAAYVPYLETVLDYVVDETKTKVTYFKPDNTTTDAMLGMLAASNNLIYESARAAIRDLPLVLPPSAAMAGIYAAVDASRGVWKAPANVSVAGVIKPTIEFTNRDQEGVNDDPVAGKSVNAIRPFTGKGTLVWGARTLAGNDGEWRYINVRRLFIFVEESCAKAVASFVFEANDANTWVKVQAMIENFLTVIWRQGGLQGAKPEHAFTVAVGLGKTMTPADIVAGRLIVEIGLAAVRPAEFILLRFYHKMAQS